MIGQVIEANDFQWRIIEVSKTSDGFLLATGSLIDHEGQPVFDVESGFPILHSIFLGRA